LPKPTKKELPVISTRLSFAKMAGDEVSRITLAGFFEASGLPP
jgi:hypothetical protein